MALTEAPGADTRALPSEPAEMFTPGALTETLPLSSTETPTPGAWMETGESEFGVEPAAGPDGLVGVDASDEEDGLAGAPGADGESVVVAGSA